jgi:hypothetical protein
VFFLAGEILPFLDKEMGLIFFPSVNSINFANFFGGSVSSSFQYQEKGKMKNKIKYLAFVFLVQCQEWQKIKMM